MIYVFDTSAFLVLGNYYPDVFSTFWEQFEELIEAQDVVSVRETRRELERRSIPDHLADWVSSHEQVFMSPTDAEGGFVATILEGPRFRDLLGRQQILQGLPVADPFLIASAKQRDGCVVTEEKHKPNASKIVSEHPNAATQEHLKPGHFR